MFCCIPYLNTVVEVRENEIMPEGSQIVSYMPFSYYNHNVEKSIELKPKKKRYCNDNSGKSNDSNKRKTFGWMKVMDGWYTKENTVCDMYISGDDVPHMGM